MHDSAHPTRARVPIALAHDYLLVLRGAERTFAAMADLYPSAPIFTLLYDEEGTGGRFAGHAVRSSALRHLRARQANFRRLLPLYPLAVERLRPPPCDVVLSSSSAFAHGIRVPPGALHICYCHAPFRYAWYEQARALAEVPAPLRALLRLQLRRMRRWDLSASRRVDCYIANSQLTRERIQRFYGRESVVIHPPVETTRFRPGTPGDSLLVVTELVAHKRVRLILEAARRAGVPISVVGSGPEHAALSAAYPEARFLGRVGDAEIAELYGSARAVVVASVEEFGITAVEAQASGRPVIAAAAGGALETVLDGETGRLVKPDDVVSLTRAIEEIDALDFDPARAVENAARFSVAEFQRKLSAQVEHLDRARSAAGQADLDW
ncbi:MAG TPA: glycosyltransferase [Solirubrobacteraceae bacterium]|nr:glycosyltransferase [Solirubrobacteraceae bacterium]